jgi:adenylate cyclase
MVKMDDPIVHRRLTAILAADIVTYSRLMGLDEAGTLAAWKSHRKELIDAKIAEFEGHIVKIIGDGFLAEFPSVVNAVACAALVQRGMRERNADVPRSRRMDLRIGINVGDVIVDGDDIYGDGVNVAARLESIAKPGGIVVSGSVRDNVGNRLDLKFEDMGEPRLKNIDRPVRAYGVVLDNASIRAAGTGPASLATWAVEKPSIAVLPFDNMSGDPEQDYFSEGITEDLITDLSKISGLFVVARNTTFTYKGKPVTAQQISEDLRVRFILEGSVRKAGSRVRVTAQLVDGKDGGHLWADRYDRDLTDIFMIQDEITHTIVDQLKVKLLPEEKEVIARSPTENVEAYGYDLRGRQFLHRHSKAYYVLAKRMFSKAIDLDPGYARAYAGIADCDSFLFLHYNAEVSIEGILAASAKALELEGGLAEAHASRGLALSLSERYAEAVAEFEQAIAIDPNCFEAHYFYARACFAQCKLDDAARLFQRAADAQPADYQSLLVLTGVLRSLGRVEEMKSAAREGVARAERELALHPENSRPAYLGAVGLAALGAIDRAKEWAERALATDPEDGLTKYNIACFCSLVGEHERAIDLLLELLPNATNERKRWVRNDSDLDPIRNHPRFTEILDFI